MDTIICQHFSGSGTTNRTAWDKNSTSLTCPQKCAAEQREARWQMTVQSGHWGNIVNVKKIKIKIPSFYPSLTPNIWRALSDQSEQYQPTPSAIWFQFAWKKTDKEEGSGPTCGLYLVLSPPAFVHTKLTTRSDLLHTHNQTDDPVWIL